MWINAQPELTVLALKSKENGFRGCHIVSLLDFDGLRILRNGLRMAMKKHE